jgi:hypothetical protein
MGGSGGGGSGGGIGGGSGRQSGVSLTRLLGIGAAQEKVLIHGQDLGLLRSVAEDVQYNISNLDTVAGVRISVSNQSPSIDLLLDQASMSHFNVSLQAVRRKKPRTCAGSNFHPRPEGWFLSSSCRASSIQPDIRISIGSTRKNRSR